MSDGEGVGAATAPTASDLTPFATVGFAEPIVAIRGGSF